MRPVPTQSSVVIDFANHVQYGMKRASTGVLGHSGEKTQALQKIAAEAAAEKAAAEQAAQAHEDSAD